MLQATIATKETDVRNYIQQKYMILNKSIQNHSVKIMFLITKNRQNFRHSWERS